MPWRSLGFQFGFAWDKQMSQAWLFWVSPVVPAFRATVKFSTATISITTNAWALSASAWSCSLLSHAPLVLCAGHSGKAKPQLFLTLAFLSYSILFYLRVIISWSACDCIFLEGFCLQQFCGGLIQGFFAFPFSCQREWHLASSLCSQLQSSV